jgi:geranylgeranyl reductase family protein
MKEYDVIIVGAGPSGCSTAIELANLDPDRANRVLLIDKATFPRPKLCAGGITNEADAVLAQLGVRVDLPYKPIHLSKFVLPTGCLTFEQSHHFRVIRRDQFDNQLFQAAARRGIDTRDGESLKGIFPASDGVIIETSKDRYLTRVLIGADGANSTVRKSMGLKRGDRLMIALETFVPMAKTSIPGINDNSAIFDLSLARRGVPGYCWVFPTAHDGPPILSFGIMAAPFNKDELFELKAAFSEWLGEQGLDASQLSFQAHPALRYEPKAPSSAYRIVLTGDASGIDPLFGEGITSALALGRIAADATINSLRTNDFNFSKYERQIRTSRIGWMMRKRRLLARRLYSKPRFGIQYLQHEALFKWVSLLRPNKLGGRIEWKSS